MQNKKLFIGIVSGIIVIVVLFFMLRGGGGVAYKTEQVSRGTIRSFCTATGTVNPLKTILVGTQVSGRIKALYVDYNSAVTQGQLVAEIDPETFEAQLEQARANLLSARANLKQAEATLLEAERNLTRSRKLFGNNVIGQSELDAVETNYAVAESGVGVARAQVVQSEASFTFAETNLRYTKIYSPVDGIVISRDVDVGQTVAASFQTPTLFTIAQDLREMQINTNVDEADIGKIAVGQEAEFAVDAFPAHIFEGRVEQIRNAPIVVQNVVTYDVVITVANPDLKLKPGMTANVTIITSVKDSILRLPNAALRFRPEEQKESIPDRSVNGVWILQNDNPVFVEVQTGIDDFSYTECLSCTLQDGQGVIVGYVKKKK